MQNPKFTIMKGRDGQYYWNLKARNGEVIASGEGYRTRQGALKGIKALQEAARTPNILDKSTAATPREI